MFGSLKALFANPRKHKNVDTHIYSPYFKRDLVVTYFKSDTKWKFRFKDDAERMEFKAGTPFSFFLQYDLMR